MPRGKAATKTSSTIKNDEKETGIINADAEKDVAMPPIITTRRGEGRKAKNAIKSYAETNNNSASSPPPPPASKSRSKKIPVVAAAKETTEINGSPKKDTKKRGAVGGRGAKTVAAKKSKSKIEDEDEESGQQNDKLPSEEVTDDIEKNGNVDVEMLIANGKNKPVENTTTNDKQLLLVNGNGKKKKNIKASTAKSKTRKPVEKEEEQAVEEEEEEDEEMQPIAKKSKKDAVNEKKKGAMDATFAVDENPAESEAITKNKSKKETAVEKKKKKEDIKENSKPIAVEGKQTPTNTTKKGVAKQKKTAGKTETTTAATKAKDEPKPKKKKKTPMKTVRELLIERRAERENELKASQIKMKLFEQEIMAAIETAFPVEQKKLIAVNPATIKENKTSPPLLTTPPVVVHSDIENYGDNEDDSDPKTTSGKKQKLTKQKVKAVPKLNKTETDLSKINFNVKKDFNLKIVSWNVAGLRALTTKGGMEYFNYEKPDIICLQEIKCTDEEVPEEAKIPGYHPYVHAKPGGRSGVIIYSKIMPYNVEYGLGDEVQDEECRLITAEYEHFFLICVYVPNSGRKLVTLPKRLKWNKLFEEHLTKLNEKKSVIICGDMNVCHQEIDLANPKSNKRNAGFTQEERDGMTNMLSLGFIDTFRELYPEQTKAYTYWTYMGNARQKNIGWRLDYFIVSEKLKAKVVDNIMRSTVLGSDHCPIVLLLNFK